MKVMDRFFGFDPSEVENERKDSRDSEPTEIRLVPLSEAESRESELDIHQSLFRSWLPWMKHEITRSEEITDYAKEVARDLVENLKIERVFMSNYGLELVSSQQDMILPIGSDHLYRELVERFASRLFKGIGSTFTVNDEPSPVGVMAIVANLRVAVCDDQSEADKVASSLGLEKKKEGLFIPNEGSKAYTNGFNFILPPPWSDLFMPQVIAVSLRDSSEYMLSAFGSYTALVYAIGKLYTITESIRNVCANLEYSSWFLDDFFRKFEHSFNWLKRNLTNLETEIYQLIKSVRAPVQRFTLWTTFPEAIQVIRSVYGAPLYPHVDDTLGIVLDERHKEYTRDPQELRKSFDESLGLLSRFLDRFLNDLRNYGDAWRGLHRSRVSHNQLLLSLGALTTSILVAALG